MNLIIDYGNTHAKVGIFKDRTLIEKKTFASPGALKDFIQNKEVQHMIISSVSVDAELVASWVECTGVKMILSSSLSLPIENQYATPQTLGPDRIAGACGAYHLFPGKNSLIIDAGSCVTFDFIDRQGCYRGGSISPGMRMRFEAVHTFTVKLPLINPIENPPFIGDSTETCIQSGVINGIVAEIDGMITGYSEKYEDLRVILCGGDAGFFENKLKASIFASPDLVLIGLNSILTHNVRL